MSKLNRLNRGEYYARMVNRAFEVVRHKHGLAEALPEPDILPWTKANAPELSARFAECDRDIDANWESLKEDEFKARVVKFGKIIIEMLERRYAWEKAQSKEAASRPEEPLSVAPVSASAHTFQPPPAPEQGRLL